MSMPLVSVIIPVYNGEQFLRETLNSALAQTYRPIEVIVVDDGSTDHCPEILKEYEGRIKCFRQENSGVAAARNRAISEARGEWIAFLDQDDLWDPSKLDSQLCLAQHNDSLIHCNARRIIGNGAIISPFDSVKSPRSATLANLLVGNPVIMSTSVVRKAAINAVEGFDSFNRMGTDDYQLWLRLAAANYRFHYVDLVLASYRHHAHNFSNDPVLMYEGTIYAVERTRNEYPMAFGDKEASTYRNSLHNWQFTVAWALYDRGEYAAAVRRFRQLVFRKPSILRAWLLMGLCMLPFRIRLVPLIRAFVSEEREHP